MAIRTFVIALVLGALGASGYGGAVATAQPAPGGDAPGGDAPGGDAPMTMAERKLQGVRVDQRLGEQLPLDVPFTDEEGRSVTLSRYFDGERPVMLYLAYYDCPMLCPLMLDGLTATLQGMRWVPGDQFEVVTVSFDPADTPEKAQATKDLYVDKLDKAGAADGWHFLTGDEAAIRRVTEAVGYYYRYLEEEQEFAHPAAVMFLSGNGKIARYISGMQVPPEDARTALVEASEGKVGSVLDRVILSCLQFDPNENSYVADAFNIMRLGGFLTMLLLGAMLVFFWRRERSGLDAAEQAAGRSSPGSPKNSAWAAP